MTSVDEIRNLVSQVIDPELGKSLSDLQMVGDVAVSADATTVTIELPTPAYPNSERLQTLVTEAATPALTDGESLSVDLTSKVRGKDSGGRIGLKIHNIIAVGSGKGGRGKKALSLRHWHAACIHTAAASD